MFKAGMIFQESIYRPLQYPELILSVWFRLEVRLGVKPRKYLRHQPTVIQGTLIHTIILYNNKSLLL